MNVSGLLHCPLAMYRVAATLPIAGSKRPGGG